MLPGKLQHCVYGFLLLSLMAVGTKALASTKLNAYISEVVAAIDREISSEEKSDVFEDKTYSSATQEKLTTDAAKAAMFMTIIVGADEEVNCTNDGSTVARFNLCGNFDDRIISLSGGTGEWEQLVPTGACTFDTADDCPSNTSACSSSWQALGNSATYNLVASSVSAATGGEYRVRVGGGAWFYFKVTKSTIFQDFNKTDFICGVPGQIQILGLNSSYEYSMDSGSGFGPWQGPIFSNLLPGTYNIKARQQNIPGACEYPYEPIVIDQQDIAIDVTFVDAQCSGDTGSITATANNIPGPYRYTLLDTNGVPQEFTTFLPNNTHTFNAVGFGTYIVQIETQQCSGDPANGIDPPRQDLDTSNNPIVIGNGLQALDASTEVNNSFGCSNITSVDITVNTTGGAAPYTFTVNGGPSQPAYTGSTTHTVTTAGTYDFVITDSNGCTINASSNVEDLAPPVVTATGVDGDCTNGGARINFNVTNANGYNLSYRVNATDPWETNPVISVPAGTYNAIEVLYEQGTFQCTLSLAAVTVTNVGVINGSALKIADQSCDGTGGVNGGQIDFGPTSGGSGSGYVYSVDGLNFSATTSFTNLIPGVYTPMVEDGGGCRLELTPITILDVDPPTDISFTQSNSNCATNTTDVQLITTSSAAIVNYSIISPITLNNGASDTFVGISANSSYIFQITDANNCTYTEGFSPTLVSTIRARVKSGGDTQLCPGATDGSGAFLIDGFANNYTYNINGGAESAAQNLAEVALTGLSANTYTITITDVDTACTDTASFTVSEPATPLTLTGDVTAMNCANNNIGRVVAQPSGGWGSNQFTLEYPGGVTTVGPKAGPVFGNLTLPGTYILSATDIEGCTVQYSFNLISITPPTVSLNTAASDFCYVPGTGASLAVTSTAGSASMATHQYRINGGPLQASPLFSSLGPGNYTIEVVDLNNCSASVSTTISPQLRVNTSIDTELPCGGAPGQIEVVASGGYLSGTPKTYEVSTDNGLSFTAAVSFTTNTFLYPSTVPGDYVFRITDNEGCIAVSTPITLNPPVSIAAASVEINPVSCGSSNNGIVIITPNASSGIPPYEISFDGGAWGSETVFANLTAGTYPFLVRDSRGCETVPADAIVNADLTPAPDATVNEVQAVCSTGPVSGGVEITSVSNGTANFIFIVQDLFGNEITRLEDVDPSTLPVQLVDPGLIPGDYSVITLDANGCSDTDTVTITQTTLTVVPDTVAPVCSATGFSNTVEIFGGVGPAFLIRLADDPAAPVTPNIPPRRHTFNGLQYGVTYTVEVTDLGTGCIYLVAIPPEDGPSTLDVTSNSTPGFCDINRNGEITYSVTGFAPGDNLQIELRDESDGSQIVLETISPASDPYANTHLSLPGNYQIIVTNLTDTCTDAATVTINQNLPSINIIAEEPANCSSSGQIVVQGAGGAGGAYEYAFMNTGGVPVAANWTFDTSFTAPAGTYDVYVRDVSGCTSFAIATIIQAEPLLPAPSFVVDNQCAVSSPSFDIVVSVPNTVDTPRFTLGGNTQFGVLNGGVYEYTYTVATPGNYVVDVIDANGCTSQGIATVYEFLSASGGFTTTTTCNDADGVITIVPNGGSGDFDYALTGTDYLSNAVVINQSNNPVFTTIAPGDYQVLVTDNQVTDGISNCTFLVDNIFLEEVVSPVIMPITPQLISCNGQNDASIDVILQAGTDADSPIDYRLVDFDTRVLITNNAAGSFPNLAPGRYEVEVVSARNCIALSGLIEILDPPVFTISASAPDFACEIGSNRFSSTIVSANVSGVGTAPNYGYSITGFENYQSSNTFEIVDNGTVQNITVYAIDSNGCQATATVTINPPMDVVPSITQIIPLNCNDPERVRIEVIGTSDFTVSTISATAVAPVTNTAGNNYVDVFLPDAGDYLFEVQDNEPAGCVYPMPLHTVASPLYPTVVIAEASPVQCFGGNDGALTIEVTDYVGQYTYNVYSGSDLTKTTVLATGVLDTANNPETINGLPGGNFYVEVVSNAMPFCATDSNIANIRTPNGPLLSSAVEIGNVGCNDDSGKIEVLGQGGWDGSPYVYNLLRSTDGGATYTVAEAAGPNPNEFENLSAGFYQVQLSDIEGCVATFDIELSVVSQIDAGIREPQALVCPNGNNAILEAYDPTSGECNDRCSWSLWWFFWSRLYIQAVVFKQQR